eukprot:TRINITY_DN17671_c0_g1_i1.p1 TRINITY_DN17671_c0_g1~~TRINITY_DN17671_c0_g1_i1.p1  ORF type:complete len:732 (+),score=75.89 TRINITY_DN17671_c0_g1_i1:152-2197(+)
MHTLWGSFDERLREVSSRLEETRSMLRDAMKNSFELESRVEKLESVHIASTEKAPFKLQLADADESGDSPVQAARESVPMAVTEERVACCPEFQEEICYTIEDSVWDAALFVGFDFTTLGGSLMIVCGLVFLLVTLLVVVWCMCKNDAFVGKADFDVDRAMKWRTTAAHHVSYLSPLTHESLASRVCKQDASLTHSSEQRDIVQAIDAYTQFNGITQDGVLLSVVLVTVWLMIVMKELRRAVRFYLGVWHLDRGYHAVLNWRRESKRCVILQINCIQLFVATITTLFRIGFTVALGIVGSIWLAKENFIGAMILNAVSLSFLFDFAAIVHTVFVPVHVRVMMRSVDVLQFTVVEQETHPRAAFRRFTLLRLLMAVAVFACATVVWHFQVLPKSQELVAIRTALCGHNQAFVWGEHPVSMWRASADTPEDDTGFSKRRRDDIRDLVERERADLPNAPNTDHSYSLLTMKNWLSAGIENHLAIDRLFVGCADYINDSMEPSARQSIKFLTGEDNVSNCAELSSHCLHFDASFVRVYCPVTCGCRDPRSALPWRTSALGCPRRECMATIDYKTVSEALPCKDLTVEELHQGKAWKTYWELIVNKSNEWMMHENNDKVQRMPQDAVSKGCAILRSESYSSMCFDHKDYGSLAAFCPETCGCMHLANYSVWEGLVSDCPRSCFGRG